MRLGRAATAVVACIARKSAARDLTHRRNKLPPKKNPRGSLPHEIRALDFFYRRGPESIFNETQRYSFIECLSFFIQLLPALLHSAYDEYPVIDD
jgi:hypothetical protein